MATKKRKIWFLIPLALVIPLTLPGCAAPSVNLSTPEPIKVDIGMRLDVYQHADPNAVAVAAKAKPAVALAPGGSTLPDPVVGQKNRAVEIQNFKNSRWVGEGHDGLLIIRSPLPDGDDGDYITKLVQQENLDRKRIMRTQSEAEKKNLTEIQKLSGEEWRNRSFEGEYIEVLQPDGKYKLVPKEG